jgi:phosphatidate cytidylyltransferase
VHLKRWITAVAILPLVIFLIYRGGIGFIFLVTFAGICSLWEYYRIVFKADPTAMSGVIIWWAYLVGLGLFCGGYYLGIEALMGVLAVNLVVAGLVSVFVFKRNRGVIEIIQKQVQGVVYIPFLLSFLVLIRREPRGVTWIFLILAIIFSGDIFAYYFGSYLGRHKLNPAISPGKTVEGALGGLVGNLVAGTVGIYFFLPELSWTPAILFFLSAGIAGQVGDLFESEFKRASEVKDSGGILPGHGGFLDRIDALLFAAPVAYLFKTFIL